MGNLKVSTYSLLFVVFFATPLAHAKVCNSKSKDPNELIGCEEKHSTSAQGTGISVAQTALYTFGYFTDGYRYSLPGDEQATPFTPSGKKRADQGRSRSGSKSSK